MIRKRKAAYVSRPPSSHGTPSPSRMPKRKRTTSSKSSTSKRVANSLFVGGEPTAPTRKEWETMMPYQSFIVVDDAGVEHRFPLLVYALVLPEGADPDSSLRLRDYWVGKIKEIRSRNSDPSDVWVSTQWLMSVEDVSNYKEVDIKSFGKMERFLSNHFDFVHTSCFADIAQVVPYVESDTEPPAISDETFYYRYTFDIFSHEIKPLPSPTCFCGEPYNPNDSPIMHFCPRKDCCKAFHADCLRKKNYLEKPHKDVRSLEAQRALQFERTLSDSSSEEDQADSEPPASPASSSKTMVSSPKHPAHLRDRTTMQPSGDRHWEIPVELLALARSPMVKGQGTDLPYEWSCVAGNLAVVTRARKLVREVVEEGSRLPVKWRTLLEIPDSVAHEKRSVVLTVALASERLPHTLHLVSKCSTIPESYGAPLIIHTLLLSTSLRSCSLPNSTFSQTRRGRTRSTMPGKRKRARLTMPSKKRRASKQQAEDPDARPSAEEYMQWRSYRSFVVKDTDDEAVTFMLGGYGLIVPAGIPAQEPINLHEYWVGKIMEIRSRGNDPSEVWAKVQWLWSPSDIAEANKRVDITSFGCMERFQSDQFDFVHTSCFQDVAEVVQFDEYDAEPLLITDETFYVRHTYDHTKNTVKTKVSSTCICGIPYNPDTSPLMHFCPRKKCNAAFHASCLRKNDWVDKSHLQPHSSPRARTPLKTPPKGKQKSENGSGKKTGKALVPRVLQFERTLPGSLVRESLKRVPSDWDVDLSPGSVINASVSQTPPARKRGRPGNPAARDHRTTFNRHTLIPTPLLALARSPMVRGIRTSLPEETGCVAGNLAFVTRARRLVAQVVGGEALSEDWFAELDFPEREESREEEERREEEKVMEWVVEDEGLLCPNCAGAI